VIHLKVLNGTAAGAECVARRFPFLVGRAPESHLRLEMEGVWDRHLEIRLQPSSGFVAATQSEAYVVVNGERVTSAVLRNGDLIELGAAQIRFSLSPTRPRGLRLREILTWVALVALCLGQVALIYRLLE